MTEKLTFSRTARWVTNLFEAGILTTHSCPLGEYDPSTLGNGTFEGHKADERKFKEKEEYEMYGTEGGDD